MEKMCICHLFWEDTPKAGHHTSPGAHSSSQSVFWTDSTTVLKYICNDTKKYVNTKVNPADEASRGMRAEDFLTRSRWIKGPEFLYLLGKEWPVADMDPAVLPADDLEVKRETRVNTIVKFSDNATNHFINYFSSWLVA